MTSEEGPSGRILRRLLASGFMWLMLALLTWALVDFQLRPHGFSLNMSFGSSSWSHYYGWPFYRLYEHISITEARYGIDNGPKYTYQPHYLALGLNLLISLLLLVSTYYVFKHWWRSRCRFQFTLRSCLVFTGLLAAGLTLYRQSAAVQRGLARLDLEPVPFYFPEYYEHFAGWLVMLALACTGITLLSFATWAVEYFCHGIRRSQ